MLFVLDVAFFTAGILTTAVLRQSPRRLFAVAAAGAFVGIVLLLIQGIDGWPVLRQRLGYQALDASAYPFLASAHFWIGHLTMPPIAFFTAIIMVAALIRPSNLWRRILHFILAIVFGAGFLLLGVTGYLLPRNIPHPINERVASLVLRFVVLHATLFPCVVLFVCIVVAWRNVMKARSAEVDPALERPVARRHESRQDA
jgi:hypothetical protein